MVAEESSALAAVDLGAAFAIQHIEFTLEESEAVRDRLGRRPVPNPKPGINPKAKPSSTTVSALPVTCSGSGFGGTKRSGPVTGFKFWNLPVDLALSITFGKPSIDKCLKLGQMSMK